MKSQIQNKKNGRVVELLIPTLNKIIRDKGIYFIVIMNNGLKIISVYGAPLKSTRGFFPKKASWRDKTFSGQKNYGEVALNRTTKWSDHAKVWEKFHK